MIFRLFQHLDWGTVADVVQNTFQPDKTHLIQQAPETPFQTHCSAGIWSFRVDTCWTSRGVAEEASRLNQQL